MAVAVATQPVRRSNRGRRIRKAALVYGGLTFYAILAGLPIYWMIVTTFKPDRDLYNLQNFPLWFNQNGVTLDHLALLFNRTGFNTWLKAGFFKTIPFEIEEAAMVDGCSRLGAIPRVILPLSLAGVLTVAIFAFTLSMQDFVYALTFVSSSDQKVVNIGVVTELIRGDVFFWGSLMAGALIAGIPVAVLYSFFLDYFVKGITGGAVK